MKTEMIRHLAMLRKNETDSHHPCQSGTALNHQSCCMHKDISAWPPDRLSRLTLDPTPCPPRTPPVRFVHNDGAHISDINGVPPGYLCIHAPLPCTQFVNLDESTNNRKGDEDVIADWLTDEVPSTV